MEKITFLCSGNISRGAPASLALVLPKTRTDVLLGHEMYVRNF